MNCPNCDCEVRVDSSKEGTNNYVPVDTRLRDIVYEKKIPFSCVLCGSLAFKYKAIRDVVFVWPDPPKEQVGSIHIPEAFRAYEEYGTVVSIGKGTMDKSKKFFVPTELKVGDYVVYDKTVPWQMDIDGTDGRLHVVKYMGEQDIKGIVCQ